MKFSVKLDPISTDIVAHCITLHIIAGPVEPVGGGGQLPLSGSEVTRLEAKPIPKIALLPKSVNLESK